MGVIYEKEYKYDEAVTQYQNCLNIKPNNLEATVNLAAVLRILQRHEDAMKLLKRITSLAMNLRVFDKTAGEKRLKTF